MRVYVECKSCDEEIYLEEVHEDPSRYPTPLQLKCSNGHLHRYKKRDLKAEKGGSALAAGAIVGGLAGAVGGPAGVAIGASVGSALGANKDQEEEELVEQFNEETQNSNFYL